MGLYTFSVLRTVLFTDYVPLLTGKAEGLKDKLRSILAQFEFKQTLKKWEERGVNFRLYLYVPELHPETGEAFCEREDEAHVLKVCVHVIDTQCHINLHIVYICMYMYVPVYILVHCVFL